MTGMDITTKFAVDRESDNHGDIFTDYFDTAPEALASAARNWSYLTTSEREHITISVWSMSQELVDLTDKGIDDDAPWWTQTGDRDDLLMRYDKRSGL